MGNLCLKDAKFTTRQEVNNNDNFGQEDIINNDPVNNYIEIIHKINTITEGLNKDTEHGIEEKINPPRILIIGGQSSGKTSFINNMIGRDLLEIHDGMCSRAFLDINLNNNTSTFGRISNIDNISCEKKTYYKTNELDEQFNLEVKRLSDLMRGEDEITEEKIYLDVQTPNSYNLCFTDSIGLILNNKDYTLPDKIKKLVFKEAKQDNTIIILLCKSNQDLETDIGISECLKLHNKKIYVVFSQVDKLDNKNNINKFVRNLNSNPKYKFTNYFFVNNKDDKLEWYSKNMPPEVVHKCGTKNIMNFITSELIKEFNIHIPQISQKLSKINNVLKNGVLSKLAEIESDEAKKSYILYHIYILCTLFTLSCESSGNVNIGHDIKRIINNFTTQIQNTKLHTNELSSFVEKYNTFVNSNISQSKLISKYLTQPERQYISSLGIIFESTIKTLEEAFNELINKLLEQATFEYYPYIINKYVLKINSLFQLKSYIRNKAKQIIQDHRAKLEEHSKNHLNAQTQNINMTDEQGLLIDNFINPTSKEDLKLLEENLLKVYERIKSEYINVCSKLLFTLLKQLQYNLFLDLVQSIDTLPKLTELFFESETTQKKRNIMKQYSDKIDNVIIDIQKL